MSTQIVVCGAAGRMGRLIVTLLRDTAGANVVGAVEAKGHEAVGKDIGEIAGGKPIGVQVVDDYLAVASPDTIALDFSAPAASIEHLRIAVEKGAGIVIGTTGLTPEQRAEADALASRTRTILAPNMSIGVNVLLKLVADAARLLGEAFDPEIVEVHHRQKVDAPSGTAVALAETVAASLGWDLAKTANYGRQGLVGKRPHDEIGVMTLRGGNVVGDHTVFFFGESERIELTHRSQGRECLALGAIRAGIWLDGKEPGLYTMSDVLGL